jgi:hypothetical protein
MTIGELTRARDLAAQMYRNFGDESSAEEYASMTPEQYALRQGIEVAQENPTNRKRRNTIMAQSKEVEILTDAITDAHTELNKEFDTKAEMQAAIDAALETLEEAVPDLADDDDDGDEE